MVKFLVEEMNLPDASGYSLQQLADIVGVPAADVGKWITRGLLTPTDGGERFGFQELSRAQTLRDLVASGASLKKLRAEMAKLSGSTARPTVVCNDGQAFARHEDGELISPTGQLHMDFAPISEPLALSSKPTKNAAQWYDCGVTHETDGDLKAAITCYREALLIGGPDKDTCFALAHALAASGEAAQAAERYHQVVEIDPMSADAWNNLGVALSETNRHDEACRAFRCVLELRPEDASAHYNLADALEEMGNRAGAQTHWTAFLRHDRVSERAAYARRRLTAG